MEQQDKKSIIKRIDILLLVATFVLIGFGMIMLYSASSYNAQVQYGSPDFYVLKQLKNLLIGIVFCVSATLIPYRVWCSKIAWVVYGISILLIIAVKTPLGIEVNGARRWIDIFGIGFQPAEAAKVAVVITVAMLIYWYRDRLNDIKIYLGILGLIGLPTFLVVWLTDDLGSAVIIFVIGFVMLIMTCPNKWFLILTAIGIVAFGVIFILTEQFRINRISAWIHVEEYADGLSYQVIQALYAIGSGGFFGKGLGKSTQKLGFIPETQNDMIFSVICEELGILGGIALLGLFFLLIWRMWHIYKRTDDVFGRLIVAGVMTHIGFQTFINTAVVTSLIPNTGVPLLFISYGGSSIMMALVEIGLVTSVAIGVRGKKSGRIKQEKKQGVIKYTRA